MQRIKLTETNATIEIPFTSVSSSNLQTRILATTLANAAIAVRVKKPGVQNTVAGAGAFTACDDANAPGVRGYQPSVGERVAGVCTFIFSGAGMETREVPVCFTSEDPYGIAATILAATVEGTISVGRALRLLGRQLVWGKRGGYSGGAVVVRNLADSADSHTINKTADGWTSVNVTNPD